MRRNDRFGLTFVGMVLALQGYRTLENFGASNALGTLLGLTLYRELGPVLTAILFAGRAGSAMAAELGLMRATDQIDALSMMAIDPVGKVVVPRFLAGVLSVPLLTAVFCAFAILGGYLQAVWVLGIDPGHFWAALKGSIELGNDLGQALLKACVFGFAAEMAKKRRPSGVLLIWWAATKPIPAPRISHSRFFMNVLLIGLVDGESLLAE